MWNMENKDFATELNPQVKLHFLNVFPQKNTWISQKQNYSLPYMLLLQKNLNSRSLVLAYRKSMYQLAIYHKTQESKSAHN